MAVKVILRQHMNGQSTRVFEDATKYQVEDHYLHIYKKATRIATFVGIAWESAEVLTMLDAPKANQVEGKKADGDPKKKTGGKKNPKKAAARVKVREGSAIRTSPVRGDLRR